MPDPRALRFRSAIARNARRRRASATISRSCWRAFPARSGHATPNQAWTHRRSVNRDAEAILKSTARRVSRRSVVKSAHVTKVLARRRNSVFRENRSVFFSESRIRRARALAEDASPRQASNADARVCETRRRRRAARARPCPAARGARPPVAERAERRRQARRRRTRKPCAGDARSPPSGAPSRATCAPPRAPAAPCRRWRATDAPQPQSATRSPGRVRASRRASFALFASRERVATRVPRAQTRWTVCAPPLDGARARLLAQRARDVAQLGDQAFLPILFLPILRPERANTDPPADVRGARRPPSPPTRNEAAPPPPPPPSRRSRRRSARSPRRRRRTASARRARLPSRSPRAATRTSRWRTPCGEKMAKPRGLAARGGATPGGTQARSAEREGGLEGRPRVRGDALETGTSLVIKRRSDES